MSHPHANAIRRDYSQSPVNVYWEMTRACSLACRHCRAAAMPNPDPRQLTYNEGLELLRQITEFGDPLPQLILTGGDPVERTDLIALLAAARRHGIPAAVTPAATPKLTRLLLERMKAQGIAALGLSLDGSSPQRHDGLRGVPGTFARTLQAIGWAEEMDLPLQINTLVSAETAPDLPAIYELLQHRRLARWSLFFLISVGRGRVLEGLSPQAAEQLMGWIYETGLRAPFTVATTEAPAFRRVALERLPAPGDPAREEILGHIRRSFGIRDGHGVVFISHTGEICPAGFLPLASGNVRRQRLAKVYRSQELFRRLHDPAQFEGRCGICHFRAICGGSRARAFAATGNPLASDPLCTLDPAAVPPSGRPVFPIVQASASGCCGQGEGAGRCRDCGEAQRALPASAAPGGMPPLRSTASAR